METITIEKQEHCQASPSIIEIKTLQATPKIAKLLERYVRLNRRLKKIETAKETIQKEVYLFCENNPAIINFNNEQLAKVNSRSHTSFDIKGLAVDHPDLAVRFTKKTPYLELRCS